MNADERAARVALRPRTGQVQASPVAPPVRAAGEAPGVALTSAASSRPGVSPAARDWWDDHDQLAELWRWLEDRGWEPDDVAHFLEHPWRWDPEYQDMRAEQVAPL